MDKGRLVNQHQPQDGFILILAETGRRYPRLLGIALGVALQPVFSAILACAVK